MNNACECVNVTTCHCSQFLRKYHILVLFCVLRRFALILALKPCKRNAASIFGTEHQLRVSLRHGILKSDFCKFMPKTRGHFLLAMESSPSHSFSVMRVRRASAFMLTVAVTSPSSRHRAGEYPRALGRSLPPSRKMISGSF